MARIRMVTRTVNTAICTVLGVNLNTAQTEIRTLEIGGGITDSEELLKIITKQHKNDTYKPVAITEVTMRETLYGMPETEFIRLAEILPPRTGATETETE